jgi:cytochrome P450
VLFRTWDAEIDAGWPPVTTVTDRAGAGHVVVTRHALVRRVLADPATFRPDNALDAVTPIPVSALRILAAHGFRLPATLANNGTPSHPAIRAIVADALHPARVAQQRPWLTGLVRRRVARLAGALRLGVPVDLYAELAADLPLLVLARLVALPESDAAVVKEFSRAALELFWAPVDEARQCELAEIVGRYHRVLRGFASQGPGLAARLRVATADVDTVVGALFFLLVAGQETTSQFLTLLLGRLAGSPDVLDGLRRGTVDAGDVVEEGLRLEPPIVTWRRVAARDTSLGSVPVPAGASVVLWLARAGRDRDVLVDDVAANDVVAEDVAANDVAANDVVAEDVLVDDVAVDADAFRPGRTGSRRHLAFGAGMHRCIGAQLSRMEAAVVVAETAPLLRGVRLLRAPWCPDNLSFRMPDALVVARPHP